MKSVVCFVLVFTVLVLPVASCEAIEPVSSTTAITNTPNTPTLAPISSRAGWRVYNDPIAKELRTEFVTAEEAVYFHLAILPAPDYNRMQTQSLPNGSQLLQVNGELQMTSMGYLDVEGNVREICIPTANPLPRITSTQQEKAP